MIQQPRPMSGHPPPSFLDLIYSYRFIHSTREYLAANPSKQKHSYSQECSVRVLILKLKQISTWPSQWGSRWGEAVFYMQNAEGTSFVYFLKDLPSRFWGNQMILKIIKSKKKKNSFCPASCLSEYAHNFWIYNTMYTALNLLILISGTMSSTCLFPRIFSLSGQHYPLPNTHTLKKLTKFSLKSNGCFHPIWDLI